MGLGELSALARRSYGAFTRDQARSAGLSDSVIRRFRKEGVIRELYPGVFAVAAVPRSYRQKCMAAVLWGGPATVVSHDSAALLRGLEGFRNEALVHITRRHGTTGVPSGIILHRAALEPVDHTVLHAIPATSPMRTIVDIGSTSSEETVEIAMEDAARRKKVTFSGLRTYLEVRCGKGTRGAKTLRKLLELRPEGTRPTGSILEVRTLRFLRKRRFPDPRRQLRVEINGEHVATVDFAYPQWHLIIEVDSYEWHGGRQSWLKDISKRNKIELEWKLVIVTKESLDKPDELERELRPFFAQELLSEH